MSTVSGVVSFGPDVEGLELGMVQLDLNLLSRRQHHHLLCPFLVLENTRLVKPPGQNLRIFWYILRVRVPTVFIWCILDEGVEVVHACAYFEVVDVSSLNQGSILTELCLISEVERVESRCSISGTLFCPFLNVVNVSVNKEILLGFIFL